MLLHWALGLMVAISMVTLGVSQSGDGEWGSGDTLGLFSTHNASLEPRDQPLDSETPPRDQPLDSETPPRVQPLGSETPPRDQPLGSETPPRDQPLGSATPPRDQPLGSEIPPRDQPLDSETPTETSSDSDSDGLSNSCSALFHTCSITPRWLRAQREELSYMRAIQHGNQAVIENLIQYVSAEMGEQRYQDVILENVAGIKEDHLSCQGVVEKVTDDLETQLAGEALESLAVAQKIKEESLAFEDMLRTAAEIAKKLETSSQALSISFTRQLQKTQIVHH